MCSRRVVCRSARAPDPGAKPNTFKLDFPIKPGESRVEMQWAMPFNTPGEFEEPILAKGRMTRLVAPVGVTFKGDGSAESRPGTTHQGHYLRRQAGADIDIDVEGTGTLNDASAAAATAGTAPTTAAPRCSQNLPKLYGLALAAPTRSANRCWPSNGFCSACSACWRSVS